MIKFASVTKRFGDAPPALESVSFDIQKGEFVFLTGPSGSGKTTLLKLLTKEYMPSEGEVSFEGVPLSSIRGSQVHQHRRKIGVVFQDYRLLPELNVWENVALSLRIVGKAEKEIEERVTDLLQLVGLTDKAYNFPAQLSGGEAQRISIARALATAPNVILADEPTGNLDPQASTMIANLFHKIHQLGTTIIFATHDTSILSSSKHRQLHLNKGHLVNDSGAKTLPSIEIKIEGLTPADEKKTSVSLPELKKKKETPEEPSKSDASKELEKNLTEVMVEVEDLDTKEKKHV